MEAVSYVFMNFTCKNISHRVLSLLFYSSNGIFATVKIWQLLGHISLQNRLNWVKGLLKHRLNDLLVWVWQAAVSHQCGFSLVKLWLGVITAETGQWNGYSNTWGTKTFWLIVDKHLGMKKCKNILPIRIKYEPCNKSFWSLNEL